MLHQKMISKPKTLLNRKLLPSIPLRIILDIVNSEGPIHAALGYAALSVWAELQCVARKCEPTRENKKKMLGNLDIGTIIDVSELSTDTDSFSELDPQDQRLSKNLSHLALATNKPPPANKNRNGEVSSSELEGTIAWWIRWSWRWWCTWWTEVIITELRDPKITISLKTLTGVTKQLTVFPATTVLQLKKNVERAVEGFPVDQPRLIFNGEQLEDSRTLRDYGICDGCTVHLISRLSGC